MSDPEDRAMEWLRRFKEEEARLPDDVRERMRRELLERAGLGAGAAALPGSWPGDADELAPSGARRGERSVPPRRARRRAVTVGLAAAVIGAVALVLAFTGRSAEPDVAVGRPERTTTAPAGDPDLAEIADRAGARRGPVLGEAGARYAHRITVVGGRPPAPGETARSSVRRETWISLEGTGRRIDDLPGDAPPADESFDEPGTLRFEDTFDPRDIVDLPTDPDEAVARFREMLGAPPDAVDVGEAIVDVLAEAGVPPAVRAALFGALDEIGFRSVEDESGRGPAYDGPGPAGVTYRLVVDPETTIPLVLETRIGDDVTAMTSYEDVELRSDTATG